jgi:hypothetical protein
MYPEHNFPLIDLQSFDKQPKLDFCLSNAILTREIKRSAIEIISAMIEISIYEALPHNHVNLSREIYTLEHGYLRSF